MIRSVFFDLDGTLVDSAPGIVAALVSAAAASGVSLQPCDVRGHIGPPVDRMLAEIAPFASAETRDAIRAEYRRCYDTWGYQDAHLYEGTSSCLQALTERSIRLHIVTNKPEQPTNSLLEKLGIVSFFKDVKSAAGLSTSNPKGRLIADFLALGNLLPAVVVGDSLDDLLAAQDNNVGFILASWGYRAGEVVAADPSVLRARSFRHLTPMLLSLSINQSHEPRHL
jgi:phosphoglycolate phosphatase